MSQMAFLSNSVTPFVYLLYLDPIWEYGDPKNWLDVKTGALKVGELISYFVPIVSTIWNIYFISDIVPYMSDSFWVFIAVVTYTLLSGLFTLITDGRSNYPFMSF